jgi:solute carrier family 25 (mitochondrial carnitine/acylcarnitine transporter), member 20/29
MENANSFISGMIGGALGTFIGYPIDTIRVKYQLSHHNSLFSQLKELSKLGLRRGFYSGVSSPLVGIALEKSIIFGTSDYIKKYSTIENKYLNIAFGGLLGGFISTLVVIPTEKFKLNYQYQKQIDWKTDILNVRNLYKGWTISMLREVPGYAIYFTVYNYFKNNTPKRKMTIKKAGLYGALSGVSAWLVIYPSDPIKTMMQLENKGMVQSVKEIYAKYGIRGFYRGYSMALLRSIPIHGGVFMGYEFSNALLNK